LGMALEESVDKLEKLESDRFTAYIDPGLKDFVDGFGSIHIDYVDRNGDFGDSGYLVTIVDPGVAGIGGNGGCGC